MYFILIQSPPKRMIDRSPPADPPAIIVIRAAPRSRRSPVKRSFIIGRADSIEFVNATAAVPLFWFESDLSASVPWQWLPCVMVAHRENMYIYIYTIIRQKIILCTLLFKYVYNMHFSIWACASMSHFKKGIHYN